MKFTSAEFVIWAACLFGEAALALILIIRGGIRSFRFFSGWIFFLLLRDVTLFELHRREMDDAYSWVYWNSQIPELALVIGIAWDIVGQVLRYEGKWIWGVKKPFILSALGAVTLAVLMTAALHPVYPHTFVGWLYPSNLFCSVLILELGVAVIITASRSRLTWRNRVNGLSTGWMIWSFVMFLAEAARSYYPHSRIDWYLGQVRLYAFFVAVLYWMLVFWRRDPERKPMPAEMRAALSGSFAELLGKVETGNK